MRSSNIFQFSTALFDTIRPFNHTGLGGYHKLFSVLPQIAGFVAADQRTLISCNSVVWLTWQCLV